MSDALEEKTNELFGQLRDEEKILQQLAEKRADSGDTLLAVQKECRQQGVSLTEWLNAQRARAGFEFVTRLDREEVRHRIRMASFRKTHIPPVARDYLKLKPSCLRAVMGLGASPLELFRCRGVPSRRGLVPLREATSRQLRWAAKHLRNWREGEAIPMPEPSRPKPRTAEEIVAEAVVMLKSAGTISAVDAGRVVRAVVERLEVPPGMRETQRRMMEAMRKEAAAWPPRGAVAVSALEQMAVFSEAAGQGDLGPDPGVLCWRACEAIVALLVAIARWRRRVPASGP
jgi:hypothetical protein